MKCRPYGSQYLVICFLLVFVSIWSNTDLHSNMICLYYLTKFFLWLLALFFSCYDSIVVWYLMAEFSQNSRFYLVGHHLFLFIRYWHLWFAVPTLVCQFNASRPSNFCFLFHMLYRYKLYDEINANQLSLMDSHLLWIRILFFYFLFFIS